MFQVPDAATDPASVNSDDSRERFKLLFAATMQGTAPLIAAQRVTEEQGQRLVEDAAHVPLASDLWVQAIPGLRPR